MVYTERAEMAAVSCDTSHASTVSTPLQCILNNNSNNTKTKTKQNKQNKNRAMKSYSLM